MLVTMMEDNYRFYIIKNKALNYKDIEFFLGRGISYRLFVDEIFYTCVLVTNREIEMPVKSNNYRPLLFEKIIKTGITLPVSISFRMDTVSVSRKGSLNPDFNVRSFGTSLKSFVTELIYMEKYETKRGN